MRRHELHSDSSSWLIAVSDDVSDGGPPAIVVAAGPQAETHADGIVTEIAATAETVILWHTPRRFSVNGQPILRRLFTDGDVEWGPPIEITDRPAVYATIELIAVELGNS